MLLKKVLIFILAFLLYSGLIAQEADYISIMNINQDTSFLNRKIQSQAILKNSNLKYSLSIGSSVSLINKNTLFNYYIAPNFNYSINEKIKVNFGTSYMNGSLNYYPIYRNEIQKALPTNITRYTVYAQAQYQLNNKINFTSRVVYSSNNFHNNKLNSNALNFEEKEMTLGFNYSIKKNIHFGAQISVSNRFNNINNPNYFPQFNQNSFSSNFYNDYNYIFNK
ncbi:MAG: hypothetical protein DRJ01_07490 [Bacteroidetes bacterium]|nr:MAG: hypothetical protein DRJ01_07490 [Bacteroidota bacterium]